MSYIKRAKDFLWANRSILFKWAGISVFLGIVFVIGLFIFYSKDLPNPESADDLFVAESTKITDRTESTVLYDIHGEQKRTIVAYEDMPSHIRAATIVAEDEDFYHHMGVDVKAILRAFVKNLKGGGIRQGGSTITQQYIKNAFLTPERTFARKIKEAILAIQLELKYSKDELLTFYLNQVPYGSNAYGVEAAAQTYFGKTAKELTVAESATLAALPQAPTFYTNNSEALKRRQTNILEKMFDLGYITEEQYGNALAEEVDFEPSLASLEAPHFVIEVKKYLEEKYGAGYVEQAGLRVVTTLDRTLQQAAEQAITERASFNVENFNAHNASIVVTDPHTGQVLAMVGSKDYFSESSPSGCTSGKNCLFDPNVNAAMTLQQPGSSFKPFAYAAAFEKGYTPETILYDIPTEFNSNCPWSANRETSDSGSKCYNPQNYDLAHFGPIPMKEALAQSRNIPAVKTLYLAGVSDTIDLAEKAGITTFTDRSRYGLSLVLGGGDVRLLEETAAFGAFATRGEANPPAFILRIEDNQGTVLEEFKKNSRRVMDENVADQINYVLSTNAFRARAFGQNNNLTIAGLPLAAKTGTTQGFRDAWTVGYTNSLSVGVWVGNNNNRPMRAAPGSQAAAPIFNKFIRTAYERKALEDDALKEKDFHFSLPRLEEEKNFINPHIPNTGKAMLDGTRMPNSILHYVDVSNPLGPAPENPSQDPQYLNWQKAVDSWRGISRNYSNGNGLINEGLGNISISFISPKERTFSEDNTMVINAQISSGNSLRSAKLLLDGDVVWSKNYSENIKAAKILYSIFLGDIDNKNDLHNIILEAENENGNIKRGGFDFSIY